MSDQTSFDHYLRHDGPAALVLREHLAPRFPDLGCAERAVPAHAGLMLRSRWIASRNPWMRPPESSTNATAPTASNAGGAARRSSARQSSCGSEISATVLLALSIIVLYVMTGRLGHF